jgi:hypothetical protein
MSERDLAQNSPRDRGSVMPMATILVAFLMLGCWALISASQQWNGRREAHAVAASAARAGAQGDFDSIRNGQVLDPDAAVARAQAIIASSGYSGSVQVEDVIVVVTVTVGIDYSFPAPGFPSSVTGSSTAAATAGVTGSEGG